MRLGNHYFFSLGILQILMITENSTTIVRDLLFEVSRSRFGAQNVYDRRWVCAFLIGGDIIINEKAKNFNGWFYISLCFHLSS